jgi:hypothetical protein
MGSLRAIRGLATATSLIVLGGGAAHGQGLLGSPAWPPAIQVRTMLSPLPGLQLAQAGTDAGVGSQLGTDTDTIDGQDVTGTAPGLIQRNAPRPMSPLLRRPAPAEATGEAVVDEGEDLIAYTDPARGETVASRVRPELEPLGVRVGSFLVFPSIGAQERFSSNIFATPDDEISDFITQVRPSLIIGSDWNRHSLTFRADADLGFYADNSSEDFIDYRVGTAGRFDISNAAFINASADFNHLHEDRGSPDDVGGSEPTEFDDIALRAAYSQEFGRFRARLLGTFDNLDFDDVPAAGGGEIDNDDRDRIEAEGTVRLGYEIVPQYEAYVQGSYNNRDYRIGLDNNGFDRDSHGFAADVGIEVDFGGITFGDFFVGYRQQDYDDPAFDSISGLDAGATITWNVTPLTTVVGTVSRSVEETITAGSSGFFGTEFDLSVDHELLRNLILSAKARYINRDYQDIDRIDDYYEAGLGADYMMNRNVSVTAGYKYRERDSDDPGSEYDEHVALVGIKLQY